MANFTDEQILQIAEKLIQETREEYIKGYICALNYFGHIPTEEEFDKKIKKRRSYSNTVENIFGYFEAREFFMEDPYGMFTKISGEEICRELDILAEKRLKEIEEGKTRNVKRKNA